MTDYAELKLRAEHAVGYTDMRIAPDVILALIAKNKSLKADHDLLMSNALPREFIKMRADYDQLKAENELMRHRLAACAKEMRTASDWICKEVEVPTKSATHWAIRLKTNADQVDGALGKGEQS
ncbi:hypothetical protein A9978_18735 [Pseudomonas sp. UMC65]|uniref:hypothetical protein n=1 Tax=Pseudomonas sp. UMC65 TaxID=1862323 RepID=UPI0015FEE24B|nr:hypothetical protein [Pseudomonas sp. UMC65]MBB1614478.1 hypothetical protein [Pseudomonas sp. UMC65]